MLSKELQRIGQRLVPSIGSLIGVLLASTACWTVPTLAFAQEEHSKPSITNSAPDPCALLSSSEVEKVQGQSVVDKKYSQQSGASFSLRSCLYRTSAFSESVSVALAVPNPGEGHEGPREFWMKHFQDVAASPDGRLTDKREPETKKEEASEGGAKPVEVPGLGDQAYWIANPHVGTLYVLQDNCFLRISLGGKHSDEVRSSKAKDLARAALVRLKSAPAAHT
jgi:hypothetical protein